MRELRLVRVGLAAEETVEEAADAPEEGPARPVRDGRDPVGGLQDPALAPGVDDAIAIRGPGDEPERDLEDHGVDVPSRLRVFPAVDETVVPVLVLGEPVSGPCVRSRREVLLEAARAAPFRSGRVVVEEGVPFQL